jgi:1-deoxy-D-xylulose-5-phosphate reductoisomerase
MGAKITIDSATMMNKGLEVIEAHHLFDMPYDQIDTILHQESIVHGLVYFKDGSVKASLGASDMRIPIAYALGHPKRMHNNQKSLRLESLHFKPMDFKRFPLLKLAYEVGMAKGIMPTVMNAANEAAVGLFLANKITFLQIEDIIIDAVNTHKQIQNPTIEDIIKTDVIVQRTIRNTFEKR